jgi:hypothetical protein
VFRAKTAYIQLGGVLIREGAVAVGWSRERVERFLGEYLEAANGMDLERIREAHNDPFMFCDPSGARSVPLDAFVAALPKRRAFFDGVGQRGTELVSFEHERLDDRYTLVKAKLRMAFQSGDAPAQEALLDSTFMLFDDGERGRIVLHLESEDVAAALRARGILPAQ